MISEKVSVTNVNGAGGSGGWRGEGCCYKLLNGGFRVLGVGYN